ncbi:esterase/lipase family protein [Promicromonospora sp. Marseille-Q5078]
MSRLGRRLWWRVRDYATAVRRQAALPTRHRSYERPPEPVGTTVVLVPGVWEPWSFLRPLAELLLAHGVAVHTVPELGYNSGPVVEGARTLGRILVERDLRDVVLVAHSKGGLIGKLAMLQHDPEGRIASMIAVNTPFSGSVYARWLPVRSLRAFVPSDATLVALTAEVEVNSRITSVHSFWDPHIPAGSSLDGAEEVVLPTPGHFRPLADPRLQALLLERLAR